MRRLAPVLALVLLAGCTAPLDEDPEDPLFGLCPQWAQGHGAQTVALQVEAGTNASRELGPADARYLERPLDLFRVHIDRLETNGTVRLRALDADGQRLSLRDYRPSQAQIVPALVLDASAAGQDFDVFLSPVLEDAPGAPTPASLDWSAEGGPATIAYGVTYHYKVCGV